MATRDLVLVDTCVWVPFFNRPRSREKQILDELLDDDRAAIIGPVLAEVLIGFRQEAQADWVASLLKGLHFLEMGWESWRTAAGLGRRSAAAGHSLPLSDLALCAVAIEQDAQLYSTDPHFDVVSQVKRFKPG
jgi:predicted nucleic acid-binding protein